MADISACYGVSKTFGGLAAVSGVDLTVDEGEIHCLIGPNGAGKSTLFKLIVGHLSRPLPGSIAFRGDDITGEQPSARVQRGMSIKMQTPSVFKELPVRQNIQIALQHHVSEADLAARGRPPAEAPRADRRRDQAGGRAGPRPAAMARDRHGAGLEAGSLLLLDEPTAGMSTGGDLSHRRT